MKIWIFAKLGFDGSILPESAGPYEAEPTVTALWKACEVGSDKLETKKMYLNRWSAVEGGSNVIPFTTVDAEHCDEFLILVLTPRSSSDVRVEGFSPPLKPRDQMRPCVCKRRSRTLAHWSSVRPLPSMRATWNQCLP